MPTYRNDSTTTSYLLKNIGGKTVQVDRGDTIQTYEILSQDGLTQIDPAPYWNPVLANASVVFTAAGSKTVAIADLAQVQAVKIWQVSGCNVEVYRRDQANTPSACKLRPGDSATLTLRGRTDQLVLVADGAGACTVIQSVEPIEF